MKITSITRPVMLVSLAFMTSRISLACDLEETQTTHKHVISASQEDRIIALINQYPKYNLKEHGYAVMISENQKVHPDFGILSHYIRLGYNHSDRFETVAHLYTNTELTQLYRDNVITAKIEFVKK